MHAKGRLRGKNIRYIKNPNITLFRRPEPLSEMRAIQGEHNITKTKASRKPNFPERDVPVANKPKKAKN
jgi:hypothetical protein